MLKPVQNCARVGQKSGACRAQLHAATGPVKQPGAQLHFQAGDLKTQRRLRHMQLLRGTGKAQFLGQNSEIAQLPHFHD